MSARAGAASPTRVAPPTRRRLRVTGTVQGVGFRPFAHRLATGLGLVGWVRNGPDGAEIEVEGSPETIERFATLLRRSPPPLCRIEGVESRTVGVRRDGAFAIVESETGVAAAPSIPADMATCAECAREIADPTDRRHRYPFTNCTNCGPRLSIILALPYDRAATTMARFPMCARCRAEYEDPLDRRFHAQPIACPACGPQLAAWDATGRVVAEREAALATALDAIRSGRIVAVKGLGGFQFVVDARDHDAVATLRARKRRPTKPFALMARSIDAVRTFCAVTPREREALCSPRAPIVLLRRRTDRRPIAESVAPNNPTIGVMLPTTPLHHLMLDDLDFPVVATSGNLTDEPICFTNDEALERLGAIADVLLVHDRPIARPVDDSIVQVYAGTARVLRRSRGFAPEQLPLPVRGSADTVIAVGGQQKATVGVSLGNRAILSQHVGDLSTAAARDAHRDVATDLQRMLGIRATRVVRDAHPDYASSHFAETTGLPVMVVQHHAAHVYAVMAEHGIGSDATVLAAAWDGTGLGVDGTIWGGETLRVRGAMVERVGHLRSFRLPGGEAAVRRPARSALGVLHEVIGAGAFDRGDLPPVAACPESRRRPLLTMLERGVNAPWTTSAGRLFDAVASMLDLCHESTFEGEGAMLVQFAAEEHTGTDEPLPITVRRGSPSAPDALVLDWGPTIESLLRRRRAGASVAACARAFHDALATGVAEMIHVAGGADADAVVLTGGCFQNALLAESCVARLASCGITALLHERVPPNDGGLALGQLYAAAMDMPNADAEDR